MSEENTVHMDMMFTQYLDQQSAQSRIAALETELNQTKKYLASSEECVEALEAKYEGCPHKPIGEFNICGCSYDKIGDICALHSPAIAAAKQEARREALEDVLAKGHWYLGDTTIGNTWAFDRDGKTISESQFVGWRCELKRDEINALLEPEANQKEQK